MVAMADLDGSVESCRPRYDGRELVLGYLLEGRPAFDARLMPGEWGRVVDRSTGLVVCRMKSANGAIRLAWWLTHLARWQGRRLVWSREQAQAITEGMNRGTEWSKCDD